MKAVMINSVPKICEKVAKKDCTILVKKSIPKIDVPFKCYLYCAKAAQAKDKLVLTPFGYAAGDYESDLTERGDGKVIGEFVCDKITQYNCDRYFQEYFVAGYVGAYMPLREMCLTQKDLLEYGKSKTLYGWHISNLVIYDTPKSLEMFPTGKTARDCGCGGYMVYDKILTRPPRSWCYVEDKESRND